MRAMVIDRFGGPAELTEREVPDPEVGPGEVLLRVEVAGVGEWDPFEREGGYAEMLGLTPRFPYVLGSEGAGTVAAIGEGVDRFAVGDRAFAAGFLNPKGGFYAQYAAVAADLVAPVPTQLTVAQAGVVSGVGLTALRGLDDTLAVGPGESVAVVGASGGVGHLAVQLARRMGARVVAVASGPDGVELCERLGAAVALDGRADGAAAAVRAAAPDGLDAVLLATGGAVADDVLGSLREGGRAAHPSGVEVGEVRGDVDLRRYDGEPDGEIIDRLLDVIGTDPFEVHVHATFPLAEAAEAHRALARHHLGKLALRVP